MFPKEKPIPLVSSFGKVTVASRRNLGEQSEPCSTDFKPESERSELGLPPDSSFDGHQPHTDPGQTHSPVGHHEGNWEFGSHFLQAHQDLRPVTQFPLVWTGLLTMDLVISQAPSNL